MGRLTNTEVVILAMRTYYQEERVYDDPADAAWEHDPILGFKRLEIGVFETFDEDVDGCDYKDVNDGRVDD